MAVISALSLAIVLSPTQINWAPKEVPLSEIKQRARFEVLLPPKQFAHKDATCRIVWVQRNEWINYPSRQAVFLKSTFDGGDVEVIQAPRIKVYKNKDQSASDRANIRQIVSQGYFSPILPVNAPGVNEVIFSVRQTVILLRSSAVDQAQLKAMASKWKQSA